VVAECVDIVKLDLKSSKMKPFPCWDALANDMTMISRDAPARLCMGAVGDFSGGFVLLEAFPDCGL